jgi:hypothetical protein
MNRRDRRWIVGTYAVIGIICFMVGVALWWAWWACVSGLLLLGLAVWIWFEN